MKPLSGLGVLVTRPAHQAGGLIERLQQAGADTFALPVIEIEAITHPALRSDYDLMIFISANAVMHGAQLYTSASHKPRIAAIGQATARALRERDIAVNLTPDHAFTSEALLALDTFSPEKISGQRIVIVRGEGGREHLADTLRARGARVDYAEVYRRIQPQTDVRWLQALWEQQRIGLVMVSSNEALENLYHMLEKQRHWLLQTPLLVPGERCHQRATQLDFNFILTASSASDDAMMQTILNWHKNAV
jgi:uroporphyrinogen-III synthase